MNATVLNLADRYDCERAREEFSQRQSVTPTNDFVTSDYLAASQAESRPILTEQQDFMTNSEIHDFCNIAELEFLERNLFTQTTLPSRQSALIEAILNDFCLSPAYQCTAHIDYAADGVPYFRFRHEVIRTYSRQPNRDDNVLQEADSLSDCSSSLSVQEDNTVEAATGHIEVFDANASLLLCENLKSLTDYYTQNSLHEEDGIPSVNAESNQDFLPTNLSEMHPEQIAITKQIKLENITKLIDMPLDSNGTSLIIENVSFGESNDPCKSPNPLWSYDDFHWHDNDDYQLNVEHWLNINDKQCLTDENTEDTPTLLDFELTLNNELNIEFNLLDKKDGTLKYITSKEEMYTDENIPAILKSESSDVEPMIKDAGLTQFQKNEISVTLNSQPILSKTTNSTVNQKNDSCEDFTTQKDDLKVLAFDTANSSKLKSNSTVDFHTAANKVIKVSAETVKRVDKLLQNLPEITVDDDVNEVADRDLQTMISKDACAYKLNEQLKEEPLSPTRQEATNKIEDLFGDVDDIVNMLGNEWAPDDLPSNTLSRQLTQTQCVGFRTASSKSIQISDKAKQRAAHLLVDLPKIPIKEKYNEQSIDNNQELNVSPLKEGAVDSFQDVKKIFTNSKTESLREWNRPVISKISTVKENLNNFEDKRNISSPGSNNGKRKLNHCDYTETTPLYPNNQHRKLQRLSDSNVPKTNAEHEQMKLSLSQLSQRSPLTECATGSIISRKNLLSLSKRRSQKQRQVQRRLNNNNNNSSLPSTATAASEASTPNRQKLTVVTSKNEVRTPVIQNGKETFLYDLASATSTPIPTAVIAGEKAKYYEEGNSLQFGKCYDTPEISPIGLARRSQSCRGPGLRRSRSTLEKKEN